MAHEIDVLNELEEDYIVNGKAINRVNIPYYKRKQSYFSTNELEALEDYIRANEKVNS